MDSRYTLTVRILRGITRKCLDGVEAFIAQADIYARLTIRDYLLADLRELERIWPPDLDRRHLARVTEMLEEPDHNAFRAVAAEIIPEVEDQIDDYYRSQPGGDLSNWLLELLHPVIVESSYALYRTGRYREAVLNAMVAIFDLIRTRTNIDRDGARLVADAFSLDNPTLIFSNLTTESGENDQKGFIQILQGAYLGIRNPKAHSLQSDLDERNAAQYLVFASLLARRVAEARRA